MIRSYSDLITLPTFIERYRYLKVSGQIGEDTFGYDRYLNQILYTSPEWRKVRRDVIVRDLGCDLGIRDREILDTIIVHHMNPITKRDILDREPIVFDPEFLICTSPNTHEAIHYGDESLLVIEPIVRRPNDTCPWR